MPASCVSGPSVGQDWFGGDPQFSFKTLPANSIEQWSFMSPLTDSDEQMQPAEYRTLESKALPTWLPMLIWSVVAFAVGAIFSAGMGWGKNDSALQTMSTQLVEIKTALQVLNEKYTVSDKSIGQKIQEFEDHFTRMEEHLGYQDKQILVLQGERSYRK